MAKQVLLVAVAVLGQLCLSWIPLAWGQLEGDNYRLPNNSYPVRYDLVLTTYVHEDGSARQFRFDGRVRIELIVKDEVANSSVTVHYRKINITHVRLWSVFENGTERVLLDDESSFVLDPVREFVTVTAPEGMELRGTYFLEFDYYGELREDNAGFYRSSYVDDEGTVHWLATTQFSSTDARHAFPCYDEPGIRAPIGLTVLHGEKYSVLSNQLMRESSPGPTAGYARTVFLDTPVMQPYLLGVIVSDFVSVSSDLFPRQRVYARPNAIRSGEADFILEAGHKVLNALEKYLEIMYPLPKIYQVAVPDFAAGAMENYGLVTYKEEKFFYDKQTSPLKQKYAIATVVGHEFGHQYFGNLVSPAWWSFLWMKEGFARYFEYLASDMAYPEFRIRETYTVDKMHNAFELDSLASSRPMTYYVNTQAEIANVFDNIAYDKGGSVMRMFQHAFGPETFRLVLINYLKAKANQAAYPEDFATAIQRAVNSFTNSTLPAAITALDILKSWTEQSGYPVLHVSRGLDMRVTITQERYLLKSIDTVGTRWILPYNFATARSPDFHTTTNYEWLTTASKILPAGGWNATDWLIFNKQQTGYYRVNYDERLWNLIIAQLRRNATDIHNINRAQLIDDSMNLARSGRLGYDTVLRLLAYLANERDYVPWAAANRNLAVLTRLFAGSPQNDLLKRYLLTAVNPAFIQLGLATQTEDNLFTRQTRELAAMWACEMGSMQCLERTASILQMSIGSMNLQVDPDMRSVIYCYGLKQAKVDLFQAVWWRMQNSKDQAFRTDLIYGLGCAENKELLQLFLHTSIADEVGGLNYFGQERERVFAAVYSSGVIGMDVALEFFMENIMNINELYNKGNFGGRAIGTAITGMAKHIITEEQNSRFAELIDRLVQADLLRNTDILRALEQSSENLQWIQTKGKYIESWLESFYMPPTTTTTPAPTTTTTRATPTTTTRTTTTTVATQLRTTTLAPTTTTLNATTMSSMTTSLERETTSSAAYVEASTTDAGDGATAASISSAAIMMLFVVSILI